MVNTSESGQSRGVLRLEKSEEIENTVLEYAEGDNNAIPMYSVDNSELDDFLDDATTTKAETEQQEKAEHAQEKQQAKEKLSNEDAMKIAVMGLGQIAKTASELTGKEIVLGEIPTTLFAVLTAPLIQKYKPKMTINPDGVDLDSWMPEIMALGGACAAGVPIYMQVNSEQTKVVKNGD